MSIVRDASRSEFRCCLQKVLIPQNVKRRAICLFCFSFPPLPKRAKYRSGASTEYARSANTPEFILITGPRHGRLLDCTLAGLLQPIPAPATIQLCFQFFDKGQQIMHIIDRVFRHARRQRSLCPIRLLRTLQEGKSEITVHQRSEAKFANAKETSCDQCVEDSLRCQIQTATQHS